MHNNYSTPQFYTHTRIKQDTYSIESLNRRASFQKPRFNLPPKKHFCLSQNGGKGECCWHSFGRGQGYYSHPTICRMVQTTKNCLILIINSEEVETLEYYKNLRVGWSTKIRKIKGISQYWPVRLIPWIMKLFLCPLLT